MRLTDALPYVMARGLSPLLEVECAGNCKNTFTLAQGFAWPCQVQGEEVPMVVFFCSPVCLLEVLHPAHCGHC